MQTKYDLEEIKQEIKFLSDLLIGMVAKKEAMNIFPHFEC